MKFKTINGVYRPELDNIDDVLFDEEKDEWRLKPGEFCWWNGHVTPDGIRVFGQPDEPTHAALWYVPPEGSAHPYHAHVTTIKSEQDRRGNNGKYWWWNGDKERPTLKPSIGIPAEPPYTWHGYLTSGVWAACE